MGGTELRSNQDHTPGWVTHKQENNYISQVLPKVQGSEPHIRLPSFGMLSLRNICFWRLVGLTFKKPKGLWEIAIPLLKGLHKILHTLGPRAEIVIWKELGSDHLLILVKSPREAEGNWSSPPGDSHFGEFILLCGHWCWQASFWNPPSSLLAWGSTPAHPLVWRH